MFTIRRNKPVGIPKSGNQQTEIQQQQQQQQQQQKPLLACLGYLEFERVFDLFSEQAKFFRYKYAVLRLGGMNM